MLDVIFLNNKNCIFCKLHTVHMLTLTELFCHILWFYSSKETFDCKCGPEHESHLKSVNMLNVLLICVWISLGGLRRLHVMFPFFCHLFSLSTSLFSFHGVRCWAHISHLNIPLRHDNLRVTRYTSSSFVFFTAAALLSSSRSSCFCYCSVLFTCIAAAFFPLDFFC